MFFRWKAFFSTGLFFLTWTTWEAEPIRGLCCLVQAGWRSSFPRFLLRAVGFACLVCSLSIVGPAGFAHHVMKKRTQKMPFFCYTWLLFRADNYASHLLKHWYKTNRHDLWANDKNFSLGVKNKTLFCCKTYKTWKDIWTLLHVSFVSVAHLFAKKNKKIFVCLLHVMLFCGWKRCIPTIKVLLIRTKSTRFMG